MKISVTALPVEEVVQDIAKQWNVSLKEDSGEFIVEVPKELGKGMVRGSSFGVGLGVIEYNCTFFKDFQIQFTMNRTHPLKFIFCSEGEASHTFAEDNDEHNINTFQNVIVSSSGNNGHVLNFKANQKAYLTSIEIIRDHFSKRKNYNFEDLDPVLKEVFEDSVAEKKFFYQGNYSIRAADIVSDINQKEVTGFLRSVYLEGKIYNMLALQIEQYHDDQEGEKLPQILRQSDIEKVHQVTEIIKNDLGKNHSVEALAKEVGTNVNKLQEGFKYLYDTTVNKYMQQVKLEAARERLENSDSNISEIVHQIGLNNRSYFSKIFKERYGVSPKYFLKSRQDTSGDFDNED